MTHVARSLVVAFAALGLVSPRASAQYAAGTVFAVRVASDTSVKIVPYQFSGTWNVGSALSASLTGTSALTMSSAAATEGALTISANGRYLGLAGYRTGIQNTGTDRVLGRVDLTTGSFSGPAAIDTTTSLTNTEGYTSNSVNSAVWNSAGNRYWAAGTGTGGGTRTNTFGSTVGSVQLHASPENTRVVSIFNNQLYASSKSVGTVGILAVGAGLPVVAGQTVVRLANTGTSGGSSPSPSGFALSPDGTLLYIADDRTYGAGLTGGGIQKWKLNTTTGSFDLLAKFGTGTGSTVGARGLAVDFTTADPTIYAVTTESTNNRILRFQDVLDNQTGLTVIATSVSSDLFRGVAVIAPVPEPAMVVGLAALGLGAIRLARRRQTSAAR
jgi:hypothetical protein